MASPSIAPQQVRSGITDALNFVANNFQEQINQLNSDIGELQFAINSNNYSNTDELIEKYRQKVQERDMMQEFVNNVHSINASDYDVTLHSSIGIALNNTFATNTTDFRPCVLIGKDEEHDLALLQLKDKKTPENCYVFRLQNNRPQAAENKKSRPRRASRDEGESYTSLTGKKVYLVGFNLGPTLALTSEGIKAQVTSGEISQDTDKDIVMYTIPTLHGSSGAPVVNAQGRLIAINFAGLDETQSFNYGIKVHHLVNLLEHTTGILNCPFSTARGRPQGRAVTPRLSCPGEGGAKNLGRKGGLFAGLELSLRMRSAARTRALRAGAPGSAPSLSFH